MKLRIEKILKRPVDVRPLRNPMMASVWYLTPSTQEKLLKAIKKVIDEDNTCCHLHVPMPDGSEIALGKEITDESEA